MVDDTKKEDNSLAQHKIYHSYYSKHQTKYNIIKQMTQISKLKNVLQLMRTNNIGILRQAIHGLMFRLLSKEDDSARARSRVCVTQNCGL